MSYIIMNLGAFSISLSVKDLTKSKKFYEKLGFEKVAGEEDQNRVIMKNREHIIGLFQGMFEQNILTFNPGRDQSQTTIEGATDIRTIQSAIEKKGITFIQKADKDTQGPASCTLTDPDGNIILIDQHI